MSVEMREFPAQAVDARKDVDQEMDAPQSDQPAIDLLKQNSKQVKFAYLVVLLFVCFLWGFVSANLDSTLWDTWEQATCMPNDCFCEAPRENALIRQPSNTWTNLAFVFVGVYVLSFAKLATPYQAAPPPTSLFTSMSVCFAVGCCIEGMGSFFYHQSLTYIGQWFDNLGMYLSLSAFVLYEIAHLGYFNPSKFVHVYVAVNCFFGYMLWAYPVVRRYAFTALMIATVLSVVLVGVKQKPKMNYWYLGIALGTFVVAFIIWNLDLHGIWCNPTAVIQGHALWHIMCALAQLFAYWFFQSEDVAA